MYVVNIYQKSYLSFNIYIYPQAGGARGLSRHQHLWMALWMGLSKVIRTVIF